MKLARQLNWQKDTGELTQMTAAYIGPDVGVPFLKLSGVGHSLAAGNVDEGQADGGAKTGVEPLIDLLLIPDDKEGAGCSEAHNAGPHDDQQQSLHASALQSQERTHFEPLCVELCSASFDAAALSCCGKRHEQ